jgi:hypothetical protein
LTTPSTRCAGSGDELQAQPAERERAFGADQQVGEVDAAVAVYGRGDCGWNTSRL